MEISGFIRTDLINYPGKMASTIFTQGCNLKCPYCHNSQLIPEIRGTMNSSEIVTSIIDNKRKINHIVITGGEPLLQKNLHNTLLKLKAEDIKIKLDTNGIHYNYLDLLLQGNLVDYVAIDIKSKHYTTVGGDKMHLYNVIQSIIKAQVYNIPLEIRITMHKETIKEDHLMQLLHGIDTETWLQVCTQSDAGYTRETIDKIIERVRDTIPYFNQNKTKIGVR